MIDRYLIGNAQTIGCREVQNNYFATAYNDDGDMLAVLADGAIDHRNGRMASIVAVGSCIDTFTRKFSPTGAWYTDKYFLDMAVKANRSVQDIVYIGKNPRLSLTLVLLRDSELCYFNIGDNRIFLYDGHGERVFGKDHNNPYAEGEFSLEPKYIIGLLSSGAYANVHPMERIKIVESKAEIFDKAQDIIESVSRKGLTIQINATALLIEVKR